MVSERQSQRSKVPQLTGKIGAMMNGLQTLPQWRSYFNTPGASLLGLMNALYPIGKILAIFPTTWLSDRYGRKTPMWIGFSLLVLGATIQAASQNVAMFLVSRFLLGAATAFVAVPSPILVAELAYPTHRGKLTALYNTFYVRLFPHASTYYWLTSRIVCGFCSSGVVDLWYF